MKFEDFNLRPALNETLNNLKFENCTPIQDAVIPIITEGKDVFGLAQTGTGKTAAFLLPTMERILCSRVNMDEVPEAERELVKARAFPDWEKTHFVLILTPTRELAEQITQDVERFGKGAGLEGAAIYGGSSYETQKAQIAKGVEFLVGTPGRLIDLYKSHALDFKQVRSVIFDEADRMFDMGFKEDMKYILSRIPRERQMLMFSATLNFDVLTTAYEFGSDPLEIDVSRDQAKAENVKDGIFHVGHFDKPSFLISVLKKYNPKQVIIFSNFKHNVERIARFLSENGYPALGISSLLTQAQRNKVMEQFKAENDRNILVATDVAARGLDIKGVDMVFNYDLPDDAENYVHRIGRTGRAGQEGQAISFVSDRDVDALKRVEDYLKHKVEVLWIDDAEIVKDFKPFRSDEGRYDRPAFASSKSSSEFRKGGSGAAGRGGPGGGRGDRGASRAGSPRESASRNAHSGAGAGGSGGAGISGSRPGSPTHLSAAGSAGEAAFASGGSMPNANLKHPAGANSSSGGKKSASIANGKSGAQSHKARAGGPTPKADGATKSAHKTNGTAVGASAQGRNRPRPSAKSEDKKSAGSKPSGSRPQPKAPPGVGAKVSGFFKKLFGG